MQDSENERTEWIFCREIKGECSGINENSKVIEKIPKVIKVHGKKVKGWMVKIIQEKSEGHMDLDFSDSTDE